MVAAAEALSSVVVRSMGDGGWPAMWKTEQDRTQTTRNPQARKSTAGKAYCGFQFCGRLPAPNFFCCLLFFLFRGPFFFHIFCDPGDKGNCFYTGQFPDVPMARLFCRWSQAPPEVKSNLQVWRCSIQPWRLSSVYTICLTV